jgi:DNA-binding CsgD family transcriptional regulator
MQNNAELSERELEILRLVATGASNKEIAQRLYISANTVKVHLRNIFAKIGVASRTEAAMYAASMGMVDGISATREEEETENEAAALIPAAEGSLTRDIPPEKAATSRWVLYSGLGLAVALFILVGVWITRVSGRPFGAAPTVAASPAQAGRWEGKAPLPLARSGLALVDYDNRIYAIAGETQDGVSGIMERYDPGSDSWESLTPKPTQARDVQAAAVGGRIYVPGGRLASGEVSDRLEIYDPDRNTWQSGPSLPAPRSAYGLAAFEGKLYLFGGWDGERYVPTVYEFDPEAYAWVERSQMPYAAGSLGIVVAGGKIHVLGGYDGVKARDDHYQYAPDQDEAGGDPWHPLAALPQARYAMGVANVADIIYIMGGNGNNDKPLPYLEYILPDDSWDVLAPIESQHWADGGLTIIGTELHALGGEIDHKITDQHLAYKAIFTINLPIIRQ